jgi:hypothetical protein
MTFLVDPLGKALVPIYADQYLVTIPAGIHPAVVQADDYSETQRGDHPLFRRKTPIELSDHTKIKRYLNQRAVQYIVVEPIDYEGLMRYFRSHPDDFQISFDFSKNREAIVKYSSAS